MIRFTMFLLCVMLTSCGSADAPQINKKADGSVAVADVTHKLTDETSTDGITTTDPFDVEIRVPASVSMDSITFTVPGILPQIPCTGTCPTGAATTAFTCTGGTCTPVCSGTFCAMSTTVTGSFVADFSAAVAKISTKTIFSKAEVQKVTLIIDLNSLPADVSDLQLLINGERLGKAADVILRSDTPTLPLAVVQDGGDLLNAASNKVLHPAIVVLQLVMILKPGINLPVHGKLSATTVIKMRFTP